MNWTYTLRFSAMKNVQPGLNHRMRELTIGPVAWGLWSLTCHDGSTWAMMAFDGPQTPENMVGWACVTEEYDLLPMVGVYVQESHEGKGLASMLVTSLFQQLIQEEVLHVGSTVVASTGRWSKYFQLAERCGLRCRTWE